MVMDSQPSPQSVGREFVRQYYTLLNKAPNHLHRFYNNNSSFVHGGLDAHNREAVLVIGQKDIHNKILQLNFRDCHAKISQVDSQATLGNGVVVQVSGELSNDGQPMRRFTQTFVLAAQSPKNYYVHNDVFRYQDLYSEDEIDQVVEQNNDETETGSVAPSPSMENNKLTNSEIAVNVAPSVVVPAVAPQQQQQQTLYYAIQPQPVPGLQQLLPPTTVVPTAPVPTAIVTPQPQVNGVANSGVVHDDLMQTIQQSTATQMAPAVPLAATVVTPVLTPPSLPIVEAVNPINQEPEPLKPSIPAVPAQTQTVSIEVECNNNNTSKSSNDSSIDMDRSKDEGKIMEQLIEKSEPIKSTANERKTYANLFKNSGGSNNLSLSSGFMPLPPPASQMNSYSKSETSQSNLNNQQPTSLPQRQISSRQSNSKEYSDSGRRTSNSNSYSDAYQLFLGNVPQQATEDDLRKVFNKFGKVVDLRLHTKLGVKANYGFITYEDLEAVHNCLANTPIYYPDADGQKLNVEEKKTKISSNHRPLSNNGNLSNSQRSSGGGAGGGGGGSNRLNSGGGGGLMRNSAGAQRTSGIGGFNRGGGQQRQQNISSSSGGGGGGGGGGYGRR